jgi:hypothetical protein
MNRVTAALVVTLFGMGCGAVDDGGTEDLGEVQFALSNTSWADIGPSPQPSFYLNPVVASKRLASANFNTWTIAMDGNTSTLKWSAFVSQGSTNSAWSTVTGGTSVSAHAATSWMGCGGVDTNRNIAIGWIDFSGTARVQVSNSSSAGANFLATPNNLGSGNLTNFPPAMAYANGKLIMVTTKPAASPNTSKRAFRFKWTTAACDGALGTWSSWVNLPEGWFSGGPGAAASSSNAISVVGVGSDSCTGGTDSGQCTAWLGVISVPTPTVFNPNPPPTFTAGWSQIPMSTAYFNPFTTIGMVNQNENSTSSARMVAPGFGFFNVFTATTSGTTSSSWLGLGNSNCPNQLSNATVALEKNGSPTFRVAVGCNPGEKLRFSTLTP